MRVLLLVLMLGLSPRDALPQVRGDEAEMHRLQGRAEEAMAEGDPDGAALSIGRAALLAGQLAARQQNLVVAQWYRSAEALFRAQEHTYRAQALFRRAGVELPASSGVCASVRLAKQEIEKAARQLADAVPLEQEQANPGLAHVRPLSSQWSRTINELAGEFQC